MADDRNKGVFVQYGCGWSGPTGWRNFDASPTLRFERIPLLGRLYMRNKQRFPDSVEFGDILRGLPIAMESCDGVYCSHVLEHLSLEDLRVALRNTLKMLRPGGTFRMVLPDLEVYARRYVENPSPGAACLFMRETSLGKVRRGRGWRSLLVEFMGNSQHLWMWDYPSLAAELGEAGFMGIRRARCGDSTESAFHEVEDPARWENQLGIE